MNCSKCNQPMKPYLGLSQTGWDCTNENCGKESHIPTYKFVYSSPTAEDSTNKTTPPVMITLPAAVPKSIGSIVIWDEDDAPEFIPLFPADDIALAIFDNIYDSLSYLIGKTSISKDEANTLKSALALRLKDIMDTIASMERYVDESEEEFQTRFLAHLKP